MFKVRHETVEAWWVTDETESGDERSLLQFPKEKMARKIAADLNRIFKTNTQQNHSTSRTEPTQTD